MVRIMINPKQSQQKALYRDDKGHNVLFDKDNGYAFSDDEAMDSTIEHFKSEGFKLKGEKNTVSAAKPIEKKVVEKKEEEKSE